MASGDSPAHRVPIRIGGFDLDVRQDEYVAALPRRPADRRRVIVQFKRALTREDEARLRRRHRLLLSSYVPELAFVELLDGVTLQRLTRDPAFRAAVPYRPEFKLAAGIGRRTYRTARRRRIGGLWLEIVLFGEADPDAVARLLTSYDVEQVRIMDARAIGGVAQLRAVVVNPALVARIAELEDVRWVGEVGEWVEDNTSAAGTLQSGDPRIQSVWAAGLHGEGQIIGIIDSTRIYAAHCFFRDSSTNVIGPAHRKVVAIRDASATEPTAHATFAAGCAVGDDAGRPGRHPQRGGAWAARLASGNTKDLEFASLLSELTAAASAGATIHTNSWHHTTAGAGEPAYYDQNAADVDTFTWLHEDQLVLGSAGNSGEEQGPPGIAKNAVCVGATQAAPDHMVFGDGCSGPTADGRRKPDLMAPGCGIASAKVNTHCRTSVKSCASSWATPHAAAAAALVRQYLTEGRHLTGEPSHEHAFTPSGALLKALLLNSTVAMTSGSSHPSDQHGWGVIQLDTVLGTRGRPPPMRCWDVRNAEGLFTGHVRSQQFEISDPARSLKVTLVWSDAPAHVGSGSSPVNDLDLEVMPPDGGALLRGNWFVSGLSAPGGSADKLNNVEMVLVPSPVPGAWTISVVAAAVNVGNPGQGYALVAAAV